MAGFGVENRQQELQAPRRQDRRTKLARGSKQIERGRLRLPRERQWGLRRDNPHATCWQPRRSTLFFKCV